MNGKKWRTGLATKTRVANKTLWALEDIAAATGDAWAAWRICHDEARRLMQPRLLANPGIIGERLATIERKTQQARRGEYVEKG